MLLHDRIYGKYNITSPVFIDLINSQPMQRLKGINQFGIPDQYYHLKNYSRFEHCIGVMLLLKKLGATEEEQVAGLLHDVSHTAFSHIVDWVIGEGKTENFQDDHHVSYIKSSVIPEILEQYGFDEERIVDYHHFGLLERDLPDLCADRVDYSLREFPELVAKKCVLHLTAHDSMMVFDDEDSAYLFATNFLKLQMEHWGGFEAASRYRLFANVLKDALEKNIISMEDFWHNDAFVIKKLNESGDNKITKSLKILSKSSLADLPKSGKKAFKKFRFVDPLFLKQKKPMRLSDVNESFKAELEKARRVNEQGVIIPLI